MLLVLLTPIIYYLNKTVPLFFLFALFVCWFLTIWTIPAPSAEAALFFSVGCFLASRNQDLFALDKYGKYIATTYAVVVIMDAFSNADLSTSLHKVGIVLGVLAVLFITKLWINSSVSGYQLYPNLVDISTGLLFTVFMSIGSLSNVIDRKSQLEKF